MVKNHPATHFPLLVSTSTLVVVCIVGPVVVGPDVMVTVCAEIIDPSAVAPAILAEVFESVFDPNTRRLLEKTLFGS
jgi:hypothetical protein